MQFHEITIRATEHSTPREAIQHLDFSGDDYAIVLGGKYLTIEQVEAEKIAAAGIEFAYIFDRGGKLTTVPVNER